MSRLRSWIAVTFVLLAVGAVSAYAAVSRHDAAPTQRPAVKAKPAVRAKPAVKAHRAKVTHPYGGGGCPLHGHGAAANTEL
jgi:hypothetical protein